MPELAESATHAGYTAAFRADRFEKLYERSGEKYGTFGDERPDSTHQPRNQ